MVRAARLAVAHAVDAETLTGDVSDNAYDALIERIETLSAAGRAEEAYDSGMAALNGIGSHDRRLLVATVRAAYSANRFQEGRELLARLERESETADSQLMVLRAGAAVDDRRPEAVELGRRAALQAQQGRTV